MSVEENLKLMKTLDDSWNGQDWDTFRKRHVKDVIVTWPAQPKPTKGIEDHTQEAIEFFKTFPDNCVANNPYRVAIGQGDWTCTIARFTGTMKGPMKGPDGAMIAPTNKSFEVDFCTVAHWKDGAIIEENLFYDVVGLLTQIGVMPSKEKVAA